MEMEVDEEYQKLIDSLDAVMEDCKDSSFKVLGLDALRDVQHRIKMLGTRPKLTNNVKQFMSITQNMTKTYVAKNHDYGNSFEDSLDEFGLVASVVRLGDKMSRIKSLINKEAQVKDESIKDTLLDMANYAIMTVIWMNKNQKV